MTTVMTRTIGRSGIEVSALGMGCWAIGGEFLFDGKPAGWGKVDDAESTRAIQRALDLGVTFFDTADLYGCGHSERLLGKVLAGKRDAVVIATKFGHVFDEQTREGAGHNITPAYIRAACENSLRRLSTDYIDLYQLHSGIETEAEGEEVIATLEELVREGKIRFYGPSTDDLRVARLFARGPHATAVQQQLNIFGGNDELVAFCEEQGLAVLCRTPLAMGLLTGKYHNDRELAADDVRRHTPWWEYFKEGRMQEWVKKVDAVRDVLTEDGRTVAQGALAWIWARSQAAIPIPGFKTVAQVGENIAAMRFGPLSDQQMSRISDLLQ
ncbi:aldo/keto reductase [Reticulibacter mediterranei]|uniref:Aldo/keto reductase n=1 Tax=Reticulibacter mediterranei TaxID=2778369 RepID=A0A8J3IR66_9CHLR|nr:aldo/keto reductase [Reticulibacter mediterranei]GHO97093.1 aldo/keto reductase [Reticulibacter mediterranei]